MQLIKGLHLTATERKHINHLRSNGFASGKIGRTSYWFTPLSDGNTEVKIGKVDLEGFGFIGEKSSFQVKTYVVSF